MDHAPITIRIPLKKREHDDGLHHHPLSQNPHLANLFVARIRVHVPKLIDVLLPYLLAASTQLIDGIEVRKRILPATPPRQSECPHRGKDSAVEGIDEPLTPLPHTESPVSFPELDIEPAIQVMEVVAGPCDATIVPGDFGNLAGIDLLDLRRGDMNLEVIAELGEPGHVQLHGEGENDGRGDQREGDVADDDLRQAPLTLRARRPTPLVEEDA